MAFLSSIPGIAAILFGFGVLIFVHELGHFLAAKWAGIRTEGFAVGMGPVVVSWRKGVGLALGSTEKKVVALTGKPAPELSDEELREHGLGETEYSLRWLPLGGFVRMLGQDDLRPADSSESPRSYNVCPVSKRMVVVSAGVFMNLVLALGLFVWAFMVGVKFEAPVIGDVGPARPAGTTMATNAAALGITEPGLRAGDVVLRIDGDPVRTFSDLPIKSAMSRPGRPLQVAVERAGYDEPLLFALLPEHDAATGLLMVGVGPASSTTLVGPGTGVEAILEQYGLDAAGVKPGMRMVRAGGVEVGTAQELMSIVRSSGGAPVDTAWTAVDETGAPVGPPIDAPLEPEPEFAPLGGFDRGLFGLTPLTRVVRIIAGSQNEGVLEEGDVLLRVDGVTAPPQQALRKLIAARPGRDLEMVVLRDGAERTVTAHVNNKGMLEIALTHAWDVPRVAAPVTRLPAGDAAAVPTPVAGLDIAPGSRLVAVGDTPVTDWPTFRDALRTQTAALARDGAGGAVTVTFADDAGMTAAVVVPLDVADVRSLHELAWGTDLAFGFEPIYTTLSAEGNPIRAVVMGFQETHKMIVTVYLTIDRLFRGSVGVEQLRGPVGIIDLGAKILPKGLMFFIFFLGMISVNLAVLNFLPLPIVDGGLFLFLVYEKLKGRPPSVKFQNIATVVGLFLIGTVFIVTFYNDIMRLF